MLDTGATCHELLSVVPDARLINGAELRFTWPRTNFVDGPLNAAYDDRHYARAYILELVGSALFTNKSGTDV